MNFDKITCPPNGKNVDRVEQNKCVLMNAANLQNSQLKEKHWLFKIKTLL